jgi:flagellar biosynthesis/type III secretory pathway chaperone
VAEPSASVVVHLAELLGVELELTRELAEELAAEREAIAAPRGGDLGQRVERKQQLLNRIEQLEGERARLLTTLGLSDQPAALAGQLAQTDPSGRLSRLWKELLDSAAECRRRNDFNAGLVSLSLRDIEQALRILRGQEARPGLYDPRGQTVSSAGARTLVKA